MFSLGDRSIFVTVNTFQGKVKVHIRQHYQPTGDKWVPTKKGITLDKEEWETLKAHLTDIDNAIDHAGKQKDSDSTAGPAAQPAPVAGAFGGFSSARQYLAEVQSRDRGNVQGQRVQSGSNPGFY